MKINPEENNLTESCMFCRIIMGDAPSDIIYRDENATAFWDIHPAAPVHILIVPNQHITSVNDVEPEDEKRIGHLFSVAAHIARMQTMDEDGYRIMVNTGDCAGQTVPHIHLHLLGGQRFDNHLSV